MVLIILTKADNKMVEVDLSFLNINDNDNKKDKFKYRSILNELVDEHMPRMSSLIQCKHFDCSLPELLHIIRCHIVNKRMTFDEHSLEECLKLKSTYLKNCGKKTDDELNRDLQCINEKFGMIQLEELFNKFEFEKYIQIRHEFINEPFILTTLAPFDNNVHILEKKFVKVMNYNMIKNDIKFF
jgi:hypothetical protein